MQKLPADNVFDPVEILRQIHNLRLYQRRRSIISYELCACTVGLCSAIRSGFENHSLNQARSHGERQNLEADAEICDRPLPPPGNPPKIQYHFARYTQQRIGFFSDVL